MEIHSFFGFENVVEKLAAKPNSLIQQRNSNLAEAFMNVRSQIDGKKAVHRGQRGSWQQCLDITTE